MIVYWADRCTKVNDELHRPSMQDYVSGLILTAILLILIIIQPDVGGFSINFAIAALIIMASGYNSRWTILIFDGLLLIGMVALPSLAKVVATGHIKTIRSRASWHLSIRLGLRAVPAVSWLIHTMQSAMVG